MKNSRRNKRNFGGMQETLTSDPRGITLIALIITIIVMLILVAVSISIALNSNLFRKAGEVAGETDSETIKEERISSGSVKIGETVYNSIDEYLATNPGVPAEGITFTPYDDVPKDGNGCLTENATYTDENGDTATIPTGFKVSEEEGENTIATGLVIQDSSGNEYVWVPVPNVIWNGTTTVTSGTYTPMAVLQSDYTYTGFESGYYRGMLYTFTGTTSTYESTYTLGPTDDVAKYREPNLTTNTTTDTYIKTTYAGSNYDLSSSFYSSVLGFADVPAFATHMITQYNNMIESIDTYKGFYIARYETSLSGSVAQSKEGKIPMVQKNWYVMYRYQSSERYSSNPYSSSTSVVCSMITGSQWDATLNWILRGEDADHVTAMTNVGHTTSEFTTKPYPSGGTTYSTNYSGATPYHDKANNIYDLEGNVYEWTSEQGFYYGRTLRGGAYASAKDSSARNVGFTDSDLFKQYGSRMALYLQLP